MDRESEGLIWDKVTFRLTRKVVVEIARLFYRFEDKSREQRLGNNGIGKKSVTKSFDCLLDRRRGRRLVQLVNRERINLEQRHVSLKRKKSGC